MKSIYLFFSVFLFSGLAKGVCPPPEYASFNKWSDTSTWDGSLNTPNSVPSESDVVTIKGNVVIDVSHVKVRSIQIESGGHLIFSDDVDVHLTAYYIMVDSDGTLEIGTEDCPHSSIARITLIGEPSDNIDVGHMGAKFLGVGSGGTLELHGTPKKGWTKITQTLEKNPADATLYSFEASGSGAIGGLQILRVNPADGNVISQERVWISQTKQSAVESRTLKIKEFVDAASDGDLIAFSVCRTIKGSNYGLTDLSSLADVVETLGYGQVNQESPLRTLGYYEAYAFVAVKGDTSRTIEKYVIDRDEESGQLADLEQDFGPSDDFNIQVVSYSNKDTKYSSFSTFLIQKNSYGIHTLPVVDDVSSWNAGDEMFITSTDYDWTQIEYGEVISTAGNEVTFKLFPKYQHYGKIYKNVDMRAEIGVIPRNVIIEGEKSKEDPLFGGHIMAMKGFKNFHMSNVEVRYMGQHNILGRYSIHWHMCDRVDNSVYERPSYVKSNSIHHALSRCVTVHGTHGALVEDNTCIESVGHGYFLEDAVERDTVIRGNLGLGQIKGTLIPTDKKPTTFWITNPNTVFENNVAAGGDHTGMWYIFADEALGKSKDKGWLQSEESRHTAIKSCTNNVAHSYKKMGFMFDQRMDENGTEVNYNMYETWNDPLDENSGEKLVTFERITAYKNLENAWIRGGLVEVKKSSFSDGAIGITLMDNFNNRQTQYMYSSVIIGDSDNFGEPYGSISRSIPDSKKPDLPRRGVVLFRGPEAYDSLYFDGFGGTDLYKAGAIAFEFDNKRHSSPMNRFVNQMFAFSDPSEGNRVYEPKEGEKLFTQKDGDRTANLLDLDGSIWDQQPRLRLVKDSSFIVNDKCWRRPNWNMAVCNDNVGQIRIKWTGEDDDMVSMLRNTNGAIETGVNLGQAQFNVMLNNNKDRYTLFFQDKTPRYFQVTGLMVENDAPAYMSFCLPKDLTTISITHRVLSYQHKAMYSVDSVAEVDADPMGQNYFWDRANGILHAKMAHKNSMDIQDVITNGEQQDCPNMQCSVLIITYTGGTQTDTDCTGSLAPTQEVVTEIDSITTEMAASFNGDPTEGIGAGATK